MENRTGPNVRRLIAHKVALDAVPKGGGMGDAIKFISTPGAIGDGLREAARWASAAIAAVKAAPGNPYGDDDEAIAGEILRQVEAIKEKARKSHNRQHAHDCPACGNVLESLQAKIGRMKQEAEAALARHGNPPSSR